MLGPVEPVPRLERPHEAVARRLRDAIVSGEFAPGQRLPIERELCASLQVSRSVVRQALLLLDRQGLVRVRSGVGGGPFVTHEILPAAVAALENLFVVDDKSAADFVSAKLVIEPAVQAMAAESMSDEQIANLEANVQQTRSGLQCGEPVTQLMLEFHSIIIKSTENRFLALIVELMRRALDRIPIPPERRDGDPEKVLAEHLSILEALRCRDSAAVHQLSVVHINTLWCAAPGPV